MNYDDSNSRSQLNNQVTLTDEFSLVPFVLAAPHHASSYPMPECALEELSDEQCDAIIGGVQPSFSHIKGSGSDN
jgi:hypothetical protein